jgi:hypothetical protein
MPYKDLTKKREYQKEYQRKWRIKNKIRWKQIIKKSQSKPEYKEYQKNWQNKNPKFKIIRKRYFSSDKGKKCIETWNKNNPDKLKLKQDKYSKTDKGILHQIIKVQNRRTKFRKINGNYNQRPTKELIRFVDERDKVCVYCGKEFSNDKNNKKDYRSYDHLNPNKPHSFTNTVKCCSYCNSSKIDKEVFTWLKSKGYTPSKVIIYLTNLS